MNIENNNQIQMFENGEPVGHIHNCHTFVVEQSASGPHYVLKVWNENTQVKFGLAPQTAVDACQLDRPEAFYEVLRLFGLIVKENPDQRMSVFDPQEYVTMHP